MKRKDFFYQDNKYVNSSDIKFDKKYLRKLWWNRIVAFVVFFAITSVGVGIGIRFSKPILFTQDKVYEYEETNQYNIGDQVVFVLEEKEAFDKILVFMDKKGVGTGEIVTLPHGILEYDGGAEQLPQGSYAIKCISGCKEGTIRIFNENYLYGKMVGLGK